MATCERLWSEQAVRVKHACRAMGGGSAERDPETGEMGSAAAPTFGFGAAERRGGAPGATRGVVVRVVRGSAPLAGVTRINARQSTLVHASRAWPGSRGAGGLAPFDWSGTRAGRAAWVMTEGRTANCRDCYARWGPATPGTRSGQTDLGRVARGWSDDQVRGLQGVG